MPLPFLKKAPSAVERAPVDRIKELTTKGFSELEIIDVLRREGYSPEEIDRALSQSLKAGITATPAEAPAAESKLPTLEDIAPRSETPVVPETSLPEGYYGQTYSTEEYIDYVVREKMSENEQMINEISLKTRELEKRIENLHEQMNVLIQGRTTEQTKILDRIEDFKESMSDVDVRLGGMEKAFKETLPALIESVRALSDLVQRLKKEA